MKSVATLLAVLMVAVAENAAQVQHDVMRREAKPYIAPAVQYTPAHVIDYHVHPAVHPVVHPVVHPAYQPYHAFGPAPTFSDYKYKHDAYGQYNYNYQPAAYVKPVSPTPKPYVPAPPKPNPYAFDYSKIDPSYQAKEKQAVILSSFYNYNPADSSFEYGFESDNGLSTQAKGYMREGKQVIEGKYTSYTPEGKPVTITYTADENGYVPSGEGIPTPSPEIVKAVEYLKSLPPSPETKAY